MHKTCPLKRRNIWQLHFFGFFFDNCALEAKDQPGSARSVEQL